jgi:hypothetical protein
MPLLKADKPPSTEEKKQRQADPKQDKEQVEPKAAPPPTDAPVPPSKKDSVASDTTAKKAEPSKQETSKKQETPPAAAITITTSGSSTTTTVTSGSGSGSGGNSRNTAYTGTISTSYATAPKEEGAFGTLKATVYGLTDPARLRRAVPPNFLGTSHEWTVRLSEYAKTEEALAGFARVFSALGPSPILRIGGASQDALTTVPDDAVWASLRDIGRAANLRYIIGLPLEHGDTGLARRMMETAQKYLGASIVAFELGNEPGERGRAAFEALPTQRVQNRSTCMQRECVYLTLVLWLAAADGAALHSLPPRHNSDVGRQDRRHRQVGQLAHRLAGVSEEQLLGLFC